MVTVLEAIFRRPGRLLFLLLFLPIVSIAVVYFVVPRTYQSSATLWALHRYVVIGATGPETDLTSTPAQTQAAAFTELLQSRVFALTVARQSDVAPTLNVSIQSDPQKLDDALYTEISQKVAITPQGYNLYTITYSNHDPKVAQKVVQAVMENFSIQSQQFTKAEAQNLLTVYQTQLDQAKQAEQTAASAEDQYIQSHQNLTQDQLLNDPKYAVLHSQTQQAQENVQNIKTMIDTINQEVAQQGTGPSYIYQIMDKPMVPTQSQSRLKDFLIAGISGLGVALLACAVYILIAVRCDHSVSTPLDLKKVTGFPVVMEIPSFSAEALPLLESNHAEVS